MTQKRINLRQSSQNSWHGERDAVYFWPGDRVIWGSTTGTVAGLDTELGEPTRYSVFLDDGKFLSSVAKGSLINLSSRRGSAG